MSVGGYSKIFPLVKDDLSETRSAFERAFASTDVVVTSGGVSVGEMDFVKQALEQEGGPNRNGFDEFRRVFGSLKGYRIAEKAAQGDSKVVLGIQAAAGGETLKLPLRRFGSEWKIDGWGE